MTPSADGYWGETALVAMPSQRAALSLQLVPATTIVGSVKLPRASSANELTVYLQSIDADDPTHPTTRALTCPIDHDRLTCNVPVGKYDLAFRIAGYVSVYRWGARLDGPRSDVGVLAFKRGSTFSGRVEFAQSSKTNPKIDVELSPASQTAENDAVRARKNASHLLTQPNARGFFSFNVIPGRYIVRATALDASADKKAKADATAAHKKLKI